MRVNREDLIDHLLTLADDEIEGSKLMTMLNISPELRYAYDSIDALKNKITDLDIEVKELKLETHYLRERLRLLLGSSNTTSEPTRTSCL